MKCFNCNQNIEKFFIKTKPNRHITSPNSANYYDYYCNKQCRKETDDKRYAFFAKLDRNASDSECFIHDHWKKDSIGRNIRVGKCRITGVDVRVEPLQPGNNSGQPEECYKHFVLRKQYYEKDN